MQKPLSSGCHMICSVFVILRFVLSCFLCSVRSFGGWVFFLLRDFSTFGLEGLGCLASFSLFSFVFVFCIFRLCLVLEGLG